MSRRERLPLIAFSVLAVAAAIVHVAAPSLAIDATTLALLAVAALPWLAPVLKSITLPGGFELVLRDIQQRVDVVQSRVEEGTRRVDDLANTVQQLLFEGEPISPQARERISETVARFRDFLASAGFAVPPGDPVVRVAPDLELAAYSPADSGPGEIWMGPEMSDDAAVRPYAHHVLGAVYDNRPFDARRIAVQYGLSMYLFGSFRSELAFEPQLEGLTLREAPPGVDVADQFRAGAAWAQLLWAFRDVLSPSTLDRALSAAWQRAAAYRGDFYRAFSTRFLDVVAETASGDVAAELRRRLRQDGVAA